MPTNDSGNGKTSSKLVSAKIGEPAAIVPRSGTLRVFSGVIASPSLGYVISRARPFVNYIENLGLARGQAVLVGWAVWKLGNFALGFGRGRLLFSHGKSINQISKKSEHLFGFHLHVSVG